MGERRDPHGELGYGQDVRAIEAAREADRLRREAAAAEKAESVKPTSDPEPVPTDRPLLYTRQQVQAQAQAEAAKRAAEEASSEAGKQESDDATTGA